MLLSGCSLGRHSHVTATASPSAVSAPPPVGSIEHPRPVECVDGVTYGEGSATPPRRPTNPAGSPTGTPADPSTSSTGHRTTGHPPTSRPPAGGASATPGGSDVTVGPLTWQGLRGLAGGDQQDQRDHGTQNSGGWHYRIDTLIRPGATVTVTVGAQQRARAGLEFGGEHNSAPTPAVTFHACPQPLGPTSFRGSFFVAGDGRACVPLDIRVGDTPARHVVISFFSGRCPA
jgi:hypothetical protein